MKRGIGTRVAVAGPVAMLVALVGMAVTAALSNIAQWPIFVVAVLLPVAAGVWLSPSGSAGVRVAALAVASVVASLGIAAVVVIAVLPLFEVAGVGISGAGVYALLWVPVVIVLLGSLVARSRSGAPLLGTWLVWWVATAAAIYWAQPLTYALTDAAGADAMAGSVAVLAAPTLGMSAWLGAVIVALVNMRFAREHLAMASTPTNYGGEMV